VPQRLLQRERTLLLVIKKWEMQQASLPDDSIQVIASLSSRTSEQLRGPFLEELQMLIRLSLVVEAAEDLGVSVEAAVQGKF
jgi:hypothetical protein